MALTLRLIAKPYYTGDYVYVYDDTYNGENIDGRWGDGSNADRADRALLFFAKYIDNKDAETWLTMGDQNPTGITDYSVAPGAGLANTDISRFKIMTPDDGHVEMYMAALEQYTNAERAALSPDANDVVYDTEDNVVYIYKSSAWTEVTNTDFETIGAKSDTLFCENLFTVRIWIVIQKYVDTLDPTCGECKDNDYMLTAMSIKARLQAAYGNLQANKKGVARDTVYYLVRDYVNTGKP